MPPRRRVTAVELPERTYNDLVSRAESDGVSVREFCRSAVLYALRHSEFNPYSWREITLGDAADARMEGVLLRAPVLADIIPRGQEHVSPGVRKALRTALTDMQFRCVMYVWLGGMSLQAAADTLGVSKQRVHAALTVARERVSRAEGVLVAIERELQEESDGA